MHLPETYTITAIDGTSITAEHTYPNGVVSTVHRDDTFVTRVYRSQRDISEQREALYNQTKHKQEAAKMANAQVAAKDSDSSDGVEIELIVPPRQNSNLQITPPQSPAVIQTYGLRQSVREGLRPFPYHDGLRAARGAAVRGGRGSSANPGANPGRGRGRGSNVTTASISIPPRQTASNDATPADDTLDQAPATPRLRSSNDIQDEEHAI